MKKLLFLLLLLPFCAFAQLSKHIEEPSLKLSAMSKQENNAKLKYKIRFTYPQLVSNHLTTEEIKFNKIITDGIQKAEQEFKKGVIQNQPYLAKMPKTVINNELYINYDQDIIRSDKKTIISLLFIIEQYYAGSAHPIHANYVLNYDLTDGRELALKDLFLPNSNYLELIANYCKAQLQKSLTKEAFFEQGVVAKPENYEDWNMKADGLIITFDEYQVAPYSYGPQTVVVPYSVLKEIIAPDSPVAPCLVNPNSCQYSKNFLSLLKEEKILV